MLPVPFPFSDGVVRSINSKWKLRQVLLNLGMAITRDGVLGTCTRVQVSVLVLATEVLVLDTEVLVLVLACPVLGTSLFDSDLRATYKSCAGRSWPAGRMSNSPVAVYI